MVKELQNILNSCRECLKIIIIEDSAIAARAEYDYKTGVSTTIRDFYCKECWDKKMKEEGK